MVVGAASYSCADVKRSPWLTTASQMSAAKSGGEGGWIYSRGDIGGWIGGYWRVADLGGIGGWGAIF